MEPTDPTPVAQVPEGTLPTTATRPHLEGQPPRIHFVVVTTRVMQALDAGATTTTLRTRFWHPHDHRWSENDFESLEHALRLFVDESGWVLRQDQSLDAPMAREWIFEARRSDFTQASKEEILRDIGLTAVVLLTALMVTTSTVGHLVEADGTRIWSTFGRPIPTWVYWLAFGPSIALAVWRARYPG